MADSPTLSDDVKGFLDEANATSEPARVAWLAFLFLLTYVIVTLASVSHKDLLLNSPVRLPIINTDIPLVGFFQYAPAMLLLVYLSLLVQHVIVARKYRRFTDAILPLERETGSENPARERVHAYAFSQILAGPRPHRITKLMMQLIVYVTFALLPIATLLYFQIKFLPYHEVWITYWHRFAVILGFAMLILLTPIMQHAPPKRKWDLRLGPPAEAWEVSGRQVVDDPPASANRARLQLADRHGPRRVDRPASRLRGACERGDRARRRGKALEPASAPPRLRPAA